MTEVQPKIKFSKIKYIGIGIAIGVPLTFAVWYTVMYILSRMPGAYG